MEEARTQSLGSQSDFRPINSLVAFSIVQKLPLKVHWGFSYTTLETKGGGGEMVTRAKFRVGPLAGDKPENNT